MKRFSHVAWCMMLIVALSFATIGFAQNVPNKITYQGALRYQDAHLKLKIPKAGTYSLQIDFYDAAIGGTWKAQVIQNVTTDKTGLFTIALGEDGTPAGNLDLSAFEKNMLWLQVTVLSGPLRSGFASYPCLPAGGRVQLTTVPYAASAQSFAGHAIKTVTGTLSGDPSGYAQVSHGLVSSKIVSIDIMVDIGGDQFIPAGHYNLTGFELAYWFDGTYITVNNSATNSYAIAGKPFKATIIYEQ